MACIMCPSPYAGDAALRDHDRGRPHAGGLPGVCVRVCVCVCVCVSRPGSLPGVCVSLGFIPNPKQRVKQTLKFRVYPKP